MSILNSRLRNGSVRQVIAIGVIVVLISLSIPGPVAAAALKSTRESVNETTSEVSSWVASVLETLKKGATPDRERKGIPTSGCDNPSGTRSASGGDSGKSCC